MEQGPRMRNAINVQNVDVKYSNRAREIRQMSRECRRDYYRDRREARQQHLRIMDRVLIGVVALCITVIVVFVIWACYRP